MNKNWKQNGNCKTLEEVVQYLSGMSLDELTNPQKASPEDIQNLKAAADRIYRAKQENDTIFVFGDYDADGVCSMAILFLLFSELGIKCVIRPPKRIAEGYGLNPGAVDEATGNLIVTIDNGISAHEAIKKAKDLGHDVIVIDHHLAGPELPAADIIVDPHVNPENNPYEHYCGAGLGFELAKIMIPENTELLKKINAIAAVATVADVVPLTGDNRNIVQDGLKEINEGKVTLGMKSLLKACYLTIVQEGDIGYKLAPIINAAGRLYDEGPKYACGCLAQDKKEIPNVANKLITVNEQRKSMVNNSYAAIESKLGDNPKSPIVVCSKSLHEGIVGIIAGKLSEKYGIPAFVFTESNGILKGSGRNPCDKINLKYLLDNVQDILVAYGGHAGAAGLSIKKENLTAFRSRLHTIIKSIPSVNTDSVLYDLEVTSKQVIHTIDDLRKYAPYGESNPLPTFLVRGIKLKKDDSGHTLVKYMGNEKQHFKVFSEDGYNLVAFNSSKEFNDMGAPDTIDVIGHLSMNHSSYGSFPQIEIAEFA